MIGNNPASMRRAESGKAPLSSGENRSFSPINFGSQRISAVKRMHVYSRGREEEGVAMKSRDASKCMQGGCLEGLAD